MTPGARRRARFDPPTCTTAAASTCASGKRAGTVRGSTHRDWGPVAIVPLDRTVIEPRSAPPVRVIAVLPTDRTPLPEGGWRIDGGKNVAGWVRLRVRGAPGSIVTVRHAEVLEPDGSLHTRSLRSAVATDTYVLAEDAEVDLEPAFTFHGFRYAEVHGDVELVDAAIVAISSVDDAARSFTCSEPLLERLHENVVWSLRDNFVSVPTDCPQRDERLGWTGDAQAFASTASVLVDSTGVLDELAQGPRPRAGSGPWGADGRARRRAGRRATLWTRRVVGRGDHRAVGRVRGVWRR